MEDVARAMGVSTGSLYNYVASKQALFHWLVDLGGGAVAPPATLPIPTPPPGATERRLRQQLAEGMRLPYLEAALARRRVSDPRAELAGIVRELYERMERTRGPGDAIERAAIDQPELLELYFRAASPSRSSPATWRGARGAVTSPVSATRSWPRASSSSRWRGSAAIASPTPIRSCCPKTTPCAPRW